jgi:hypothetical protein
MKKLNWILILLFILLYILHSLKSKHDPFESKNSYIKVLEDGSLFLEKQIQKYLTVNQIYNSAYVAYWSFNKRIPVIASAFGTDHLHHFVNHYLIGYEPFKADQLWIPHYTIALRLKYQLDANQYGGLKEVWQNSKQAFFNTRGDCEDHAIVLADWLIAMGLDARVVLGTYENNGHAWVVVFKDSKVFLLEATNKQKRKRWDHYPLADFETKYHPTCMFNRDYFWLNTGSVYTTRYTGNSW